MLRVKTSPLFSFIVWLAIGAGLVLGLTPAAAAEVLTGHVVRVAGGDVLTLIDAQALERQPAHDIANAEMDRWRLNDVAMLGHRYSSQEESMNKALRERDPLLLASPETMGFFVPGTKSRTQAERAFRKIEEFNGTSAQTRRVAALAWVHNGRRYFCGVGGDAPSYYGNGGPPEQVLAILAKGTGFLICTTHWGSDSGLPIMVGAWGTSVLYFDEELSRRRPVQPA